MASKIVALMPPHSCYVEPFAGGLAVLYEKGFPPITNSDHYREVINDRDEEIVNFWRALQDPNDPFHHRIKYTLFSKSEHDNAEKEKSAWATWVNRVQGFGNKPSAGWGRGPTKTQPAQKNAPSSFMNRVAMMPEAAERVRNAFIECDDALAVIKRWDSPYTLHYCDPPYPSTDQGGYSGEYTLAELQALVDVLAECKGSIMLSNYDQPGLRVPDDWQRHEFSATMTVSRKKENNKRTEVLYVCDRSANAPEDQQRYLWTPAAKVTK